MEDEKRQKIVEKYGVDIRDLNIDHVKQWVRALRSGKYKKNDEGNKSFKQIARRIETYWIKPYEKYKHCFLGKKGQTK